jgi:zinc protease
LLDAYARDPGFRTEASEKAKSVAPMLKGQLAANPAAVYSRATQALMTGSDPRFASLPSDADLASVGKQDLAMLLKQPLGGQADVVMVGDVSIDDAVKATQATFAAAPANAPQAPAQVHVTLPDGREAPFVFEHSGRSDQAFYGEFFRLPDYFADPATAEAADVAAAIISSRLTDTVREQLGLTYSPQVRALTAVDLPGEAYLEVALETPPANFEKFRTILADQLKDLAAMPVSADELARAKEPLIATERKRRETNAFWLGKLTQLARDPRIESETVGKIERMAAVTAADVQKLVARYAAGRMPVTIIARAKPS